LGTSKVLLTRTYVLARIGPAGALGWVRGCLNFGTIYLRS